MMRNILIVVGVIIGLVLLAVGLLIYYYYPKAEKIIEFIGKHPDKAAIIWSRNGSTLVARNSYKVMPLASTVKIIIAIEYALQSASGRLDPEELVDTATLDLFYVADTDGGAHPEWLSSVSDRIENGRISIREIAKGMIWYSSNANTEWLLERLGPDNVNARLDSLGLGGHTSVYNIVSALFVGKELYPGMSGRSLERSLRNTSEAEYIRATEIIHQKLKTDPLYRSEVGELSMAVQKIWSDRLPAATVSDYIKVMRYINGRAYFDPATHRYLDEVMGALMQNPANKSWLEHAGMKGGSTAFVLTNALYATDKSGNATELVYFFNDLEDHEVLMLSKSMNEFHLKLLKDQKFRDKITKAFNEGRM